MRDAVRDAFYRFNAPMEGEVPHLYVDVKNLVSIGVGALVDPLALALHLPLKRADGSLATREEIITDWNAVKNGPDFARLGYRAAAKVVKLHLEPLDLEQLLLGKLAQNDAYLAHRFSASNNGNELGFEAWPADAQLGAHSLSWACGPAFKFPNLEAALRVMDFETSAIECFMPEEKTISGLRPRNRANKLLFQNAAIVLAEHLDPDVLYWPRDLTKPSVDPQADTEPVPSVKVVDQPIVHPRVPLGEDDD